MLCDFVIVDRVKYFILDFYIFNRVKPSKKIYCFSWIIIDVRSIFSQNYV